MIRILSIDSPKADGVSFWRNIRPLSELQRAFQDVEVTFSSETAPLHLLMQIDLVVMFRPVTQESLRFIKTCKAIGKKVIIDIDDNLWRLPPGHPSELQYIFKGKHINEIYSIADGIWCSTDPLMDFSDARDGRGVVVANAVLDGDLPDKPAIYRGNVCWRGSISNMKDIENAESIRVFEENLERFNHWYFWGYWPAAMHKKGVSPVEYTDVVSYFFGLREKGINIMWKPLQENQFNDAKSNIAWIEATLAGAVCVTNYAHKPGWEMAIDHFTDNSDFIASQWQASKDWIIEHYNLRKVNEIRYNHICKTLGV